jgi:hypothetical protein
VCLINLSKIVCMLIIQLCWVKQTKICSQLTKIGVKNIDITNSAFSNQNSTQN